MGFAVCCSVLQCGAVCCSVLRCARTFLVSTVTVKYAACSVLQCVTVWCRVLQCGAVCCSVLQCARTCPVSTVTVNVGAAAAVSRSAWGSVAWHATAILHSQMHPRNGISERNSFVTHMNALTRVSTLTSVLDRECKKEGEWTVVRRWGAKERKLYTSTRESLRPFYVSV